MSIRLVEPIRTIEAGRTYVTCSSSWTVEWIDGDIAVVTRDDGRMARFGVQVFARWVVREVPVEDEEVFRDIAVAGIAWAEDVIKSAGAVRR